MVAHIDGVLQHQEILKIEENLMNENAIVKTDGVTESSTSSTEAVSFAVALEKTTFGKFNYCLIIVSGLVIVNVLLETLSIGYILPVTECDLHMSTQEKGFLTAACFAGIIASSILWGFLADTTGRRKVILPTLIIGFLVTLISSLMKSFIPLLILRFFNGIFISGGSATIYAYLGEFHSDKTRSRAILGASFIFGVAGVLMPLIAWFCINQDWQFYIPIIDIVYKPWRLFMVVCALPGLVCFLCFLKLPESPKYLLANNRQEETIAVLRKMYKINVGKNENEYDVQQIIPEIPIVNNTERIPIADKSSNLAANLLRMIRNQIFPLFKPPILKSTLIASTLQFGIYVTCNGMYMWFPEILNYMGEFTSENPNDYTTICTVLTNRVIKLENSTVLELCDPKINEKLEHSTLEYSLALEFMYVTGFAVIGLIINAVGKVSILFVILLSCGICGIASAYVNLPMLAICLFLVLELCGVVLSVVNAASVDLFPTNLRATAVSVTLMVGRFGSIFGAYITGILIETNCVVAFVSNSSILIFCAFLSFCIPKPLKFDTV